MLNNIIQFGIVVAVGFILACISTYIQRKRRHKRQEEILNNVLQNFFKN